ncbi:hypothetical protein F4814DRAFT_459839 [Daldinia grandis]|nr:hypothetical protein F4814DRAFT_459839 [Daldinia grandis]
MPPHQPSAYDRTMQKLAIVVELQQRPPIDFLHHRRSSVLSKTGNSSKAAANVAPTAPAVADPVVADPVVAVAAPITSNRKRDGVSTGAEVERKGYDLHKWEYVLFSKTSTQSDPQLLGSFVDRQQANAKLHERTHYDNIEGGMAAVTRRLVYERSPSKLLKAELTLTNGEEHVVWVDRRLVDLQHDLTKKQRALKKWSADRPKLPHYIVECEFMTRGTTETPQQVLEEDDDDGDGDGDGSVPAISHEQVGVLNGEIGLDRLPLVTFTERGLANEHAGALFLHHSAVKAEIRIPLDDFWWAGNAMTIHKEAEKAAGMPGALYNAEMDTHDMNTRLGFDMIRVAVHAVDDLSGPLNI